MSKREEIDKASDAAIEYIFCEDEVTSISLTGPWYMRLWLLYATGIKLIKLGLRKLK